MDRSESSGSGNPKYFATLDLISSKNSIRPLGLPLSFLLKMLSFSFPSCWSSVVWTTIIQSVSLHIKIVKVSFLGLDLSNLLITNFTQLLLLFLLYLFLKRRWRHEDKCLVKLLWGENIPFTYPNKYLTRVIM